LAGRKRFSVSRILRREGLVTDPLFGVGCGWAFQSGEWLADSIAPALHGGSLLRHFQLRCRPPARRRLRALMATTGEQFLREGREAMAAADWARARTFLEKARKLDGAPEALDGLSEVANFEGEYELAIELKEEAHRAYLARDQRVEASHVARWLGFMHATYHGNYAVASGWMARAESLLEGVEECPAHGWLILDRAPFSRSPEERQRVAASALAIARRFGDADLEGDTEFVPLRPCGRAIQERSDGDGPSRQPALEQRHGPHRAALERLTKVSLCPEIAHCRVCSG